MSISTSKPFVPHQFSESYGVRSVPPAPCAEFPWHQEWGKRFPAQTHQSPPTRIFFIVFQKTNRCSLNPHPFFGSNLNPLTSDLPDKKIKKLPSPIFPRSTPLQCQRQCSPGPGAWCSSSPGFHRDPGRWPNRTCCLAENEPEKVARHGNMYPLKMGI